MLWQGCTMRDAPDFPLVSVLVASYNYEPYLGMAIQSVLDQSCPHFELLIIDDLGTELNNAFITSQLFLCINERLLARKSTIISTNLSLDELQNEYSERIFSRLVSNYEIMLILGDDIRIKKAISE